MSQSTQVAQATSPVKVQVSRTPEQVAAAKSAKALANSIKSASLHSHADTSSIEWDAEAGKFKVNITCIDCGAVRSVYTSDLHQVRRCVACTKAARKAAKVTKRDAAKALKSTVEVY